MSTPRNEMSDEEKFSELCKKLQKQLDYAALNCDAKNTNEVWCLRQLNLIDSQKNSEAGKPLKDKVYSMEATLKSVVNSPDFKKLPSSEETKSNIIRNFIIDTKDTFEETKNLLVDIIVKETEIAAKKATSTQSEPNLRSRAGAERSQNPPTPKTTKSTSAPTPRKEEDTQWKRANNNHGKSSLGIEKAEHNQTKDSQKAPTQFTRRK